MKLKLDNGKVLTIKLVKDGEHCVDIVVTKVNGEQEDSGILLSLLSNGTFKRVGSVGADTGVKLNSYDKIKESK